MATNKRRIDVMVSSTTKDLSEHRKQVSDAIRRVKWTPLMMEYDEAVSDADAISYSLNLVRDAEVYLGIFGVRYGYQPEDPRNPDAVSITEMEYHEALERGLPMLIFINSDAHSFPAHLTDDENDADRAKLKALKDTLTDKHIVSFYDNPQDLRYKVIQSLYELKDSDDFKKRYPPIIEEKPKPTEILPPKPPELYANPPYSLTTTFIGRTRELAQLDAWAQSDDPMMIVEAIGGMGKSAVTWQWVETQTVKTFDGIIWWSFYESGATMAAFIRHALGYITGEAPSTFKGRDALANFKALQAALRTGNYLLALDGLERVLVAYHRWNAAQMRDDKIEDAESIIKDRDVRTCTDPKDEHILQGLLTCDSTKILVSSRLLPLAVENRGGMLRPEVQHIHLNGLAPDDALALTRAQGITVSDERQFKDFMKTFGYHSLLVMLVAGRVNNFRRGRGNFDKWYARYGRDLTVSEFDLKQQQTHILKYAFEGLDDQQDRFLSQIAAFGDAIDYETMTVFNPFVKAPPEEVREPRLGFLQRLMEEANTEEEKAEYQRQIDDRKAVYDAYLDEKAAYEKYLKSAELRQAEANFDDLLQGLEERGLLRWNRQEDTYDMHPVVRGYAFDRLEGEQKTSTYERIEGHFRAQPADDTQKAQEVADLTNTIAIYRALLGAGKLDAAAQFYWNRLRELLHYNIAAYYTAIELLTPLFADGTDTLPKLDSPDLQSAITTQMANMFYYVGRRDEALKLQGLNLKLNVDQDDAVNLGIGLRNYASSLRSDNQLALAQRGYELALALARAINNTEEIAYSRLYLLGIYKDTGQWTQLEATYAALQENPPREVFWQSVVEQWYAESLICRGQDATAALDKAEQLAKSGRNAMMLQQIQGLRGAVALTVGDTGSAIRYFETDLRLRRKAGDLSVGVPLGGLARAYAAQGNFERAQQVIDMHDFDDDHIDIAEVYLMMGKHDEAHPYAKRAYKWAWSDGPPFVWWRHLERAKAVLDALGEPYPDMPPFDPNKIGKIPHEDAIRAYIRSKGGDV